MDIMVKSNKIYPNKQKRIKKKPKVKLNRAANVAFYKKVKAPMNCSLNTSKHARINLTMKANNAALAQRLQQVKQDLRTVIDENTYLIKENQEFLLGNHQLENQNQEFLLRIHQLENQNHLDQRNNDVDRLQLFRSLFNDMSHHLLDLGLWVKDGMDICMTPRNSNSSLSSNGSYGLTTPTFPEGDPVSRMDKECHKPLETFLVKSSALFDCNAMPDYYSESSSTPFNVAPPKAAVCPDMSVILEQSLLDKDEQQVSELSMDTVFEEPSVEVQPDKRLSSLLQRTVHNGNYVVGCELPVVSHSEVRNGSDCHTASSVESREYMSQHAYVSNRQKRKKIVVNEHAGHGLKNLSVVGSDNPVVGISWSEIRSGDCSKSLSNDISPRGNDNMQSVEFCTMTYQSSPPVNNDKSCSIPSKHVGLVSKPYPQDQMATSEKDVVCRIASLQSPVDAGCVVSVPCTQNFLHSEVTKGTDLCENDLIPRTDLCDYSVKVSSTCTGNEAMPLDNKGLYMNVPCINNLSSVENICGDINKTLFLNTDMEFTAIILPGLECLTSRDESVESTASNDKPNGSDGNDVDVMNSELIRKEDCLHSEVINVSTNDKKLPITFQIHKPGQLLFAASRREGGGSRKSVAESIIAKARSKSKKKVSRHTENLLAKEPESIFDFHDKTPSFAQRSQSLAQISVFDLSLNDTMPNFKPFHASSQNVITGVSNSTAEYQPQEHMASTQGCAQQLLDCCARAHSIGDAPVHRMALNDRAPCVSTIGKRLECLEGEAVSGINAAIEIMPPVEYLYQDKIQQNVGGVPQVLPSLLGDGPLCHSSHKYTTSLRDLRSRTMQTRSKSASVNRHSPRRNADECAGDCGYDGASHAGKYDGQSFHQIGGSSAIDSSIQLCEKFEIPSCMAPTHRHSARSKQKTISYAKDPSMSIEEMSSSTRSRSKAQRKDRDYRAKCASNSDSCFAAIDKREAIGRDVCGEFFDKPVNFPINQSIGTIHSSYLESSPHINGEQVLTETCDSQCRVKCTSKACHNTGGVFSVNEIPSRVLPSMCIDRVLSNINMGAKEDIEVVGKSNARSLIECNREEHTDNVSLKKASVASRYSACSMENSDHYYSVCCTENIPSSKMHCRAVQSVNTDDERLFSTMSESVSSSLVVNMPNCSTENCVLSCPVFPVKVSDYLPDMLQFECALKKASRPLDCLSSCPPTNHSTKKQSTEGISYAATSSEGRSARRTVPSKSYKEPSLSTKLRRGDPHTSVAFTDAVQIYKTPKGSRKSEFED